MKQTIRKTTLFFSAAILVAILAACGGKTSEQNANPGEPKAVADTEEPKETVVNYLNSATSIDFDDEVYQLAWSHPPQGTYYIQEYMPAGQVIEKYEDILILDMDKNVKENVENSLAAKVKWLNNRKKTDPMANFKLIQKADDSEYGIDLIVSADDVIEWNFIRYAEYKVNGKHAGVKTFTMSKRAYGDGREAFMQKIKDRKVDLMKEFSELPFPDVKPK